MPLFVIRVKAIPSLPMPNAQCPMPQFLILNSPCSLVSPIPVR